MENVPKNKCNCSPNICFSGCNFNLQCSKLQLAARLLILLNHSSFELQETSTKQTQISYEPSESYFSLWVDYLLLQKLN